MARKTSFLRRRLRAAHRRFDRLIAPTCAQSEFLSSLYYTFWNRAFAREHRAVLWGRINFKRHLQSPRRTSSVLRRNTHRIEKGLISRPRRTVFGLDYLEETVQCYVRAVLEKDPGERIESQELAWARDVLTRYFGQGDDHPTVARLRAEFEATTYVPVTVAAERSNDRSPYLRASDFVSPISIDALHELARHRRSVRWFEQRSVPRELIDRAARVALESPSACNRQPFKFLIFDQEPLLRKVADLPAGTRGFSHNFPCVVVVLGKLDSYFDERDRHLIYIDASLATMSFLFALESQGVASCCINWADIPEREERARRLLHLAPDERPIMFIALGFPDPSGLVPYSEKKSLKNLVQYNLEHQINGAE